MKRQPGELNLRTKPEFRALVGQFYIVPKRCDHWARLIKEGIFEAWHVKAGKIEKARKRSYIKRRRKSISDNLWEILGRLYWNQAAWIILRGEYDAMKETLWNSEIKILLEKRYGYLSQVKQKKRDWFEEVQSRGGDETPLKLAYRDTAESLGLKSGEALRVRLSPWRLRKSPPASLFMETLDQKTRLSRLQRIPLSRRTDKVKALINITKSEYYTPAKIAELKKNTIRARRSPPKKV
jgi:hypothetical protein